MLDHDSQIPEGSEVFVAQGVICDIAQAEDLEVASHLASRASAVNIVIIKSSLCEGLDKADTVRPEGLRSLARLVAVSGILDDGDAASSPKGTGTAHVTADAILSSLIGPVGALVETLAELRSSGVVLATRDIDLAVALQAVEDDDTLDVASFTKLLQLLTIVRADVTVEVRRKWTISDELRQRLRTKALQSKP